MRLVLLVSREPGRALSLAARWTAAGEIVTVVLLDAATALARPGHHDGAALAAARKAGARLAAHDLGLSRRGLGPGGLVDGVAIVDTEGLADLVTDGTDRVVWL